jgi:hypothetical protein
MTKQPGNKNIVSSQSRFVLPLSKLAEEEDEEGGGEPLHSTTSEEDNEMEVYQALLHLPLIW